MSAEAFVKPKLDYYDYSKLFSYNAKFMFLCGARGLGKTYGAKKKAIAAAIKYGDQFVYLRRYKEESQLSRKTFWADIESQFPDYDFRTHGDEAQMASSEDRGSKDREWTTIGFFIALSTGQTRKGQSFPNVKLIIFDEFILEKGMTHYIANEAVVFQNLYSTIDRWTDKTRVLFLANSVTITNPYFLYWDIKPDEIGKFYASHHLENGNPFMVCHFADGKDFAAGVRKTAFGQFIDNTEYASYAVDSQFSDNHLGMLGKKPSTAVYYMTIEAKQGIYSVWVDYPNKTFYMQTKRPKNEQIYTLLHDKMDQGKILLTFNDPQMSYLRTAFTHGRTYFDNQKCRNAFIEIFKR